MLGGILKAVFICSAVLSNYDRVPDWMLDKMTLYKEEFKAPCVSKTQDCSGRPKLLHEFEYDIGKLVMRSFDLESFWDESCFREKLENTDWFFAEEKKNFDVNYRLMRQASSELIKAQQDKKEAIGMGFQLAALLFSNAYGGDYGKDPKKYKRAIEALSALERAQYLYELSLSNLAEPARNITYFYHWIFAELQIHSSEDESLRQEGMELKKQTLTKLISRYKVLWVEKGNSMDDLVKDKTYIYLNAELVEVLKP